MRRIFCWPTRLAVSDAVVPVLVGRGDVVYSDELNHASIVDACRLCSAEIVRYPHANVAALRGMSTKCQLYVSCLACRIWSAQFETDASVAVPRMD